MRNSVLPPRHLLFICNDPSLSKYDDFHAPKHWEQSKPNKNSYSELDKVELVLDKQFDRLVANKASLPKIEVKSDVEKVELKEVSKIYIDHSATKGLENEPSSTDKDKPSNILPQKADVNNLDLETCVLAEKDINTLKSN